MKVKISCKPLEEGDKVKINISHIRKNKDYKKFSNKYINFLNENKNKIFTIERPSGRLNSWKNIWSFTEDVSDPKWCFYESDLVGVNKYTYI